jgi:hypothetical protein
MRTRMETEIRVEEKSMDDVLQPLKAWSEIFAPIYSHPINSFNVEGEVSDRRSRDQHSPLHLPAASG